MPASSASNLPQAFTIPTTTMATNFKAGELKYTGDKTDVAIEGKAFFQVKLPDGATALTRDGEFQLNSKGQLVTKDSYLVAATVAGADGPIQLSPDNSGPISISTSGDVRQGSTLLGKLKLADVNVRQKITQISGAYFIAEDPKALTVPTTSTVRQGYLESANSSAVHEMASLMTAMRGFEANTHVIQIQDDRLGKAIATLGNPS